MHSPCPSQSTAPLPGLSCLSSCTKQPASCVWRSLSSRLSLLRTGIRGVLQVKSECSGSTVHGRLLHACSKHTVSGKARSKIAKLTGQDSKRKNLAHIFPLHGDISSSPFPCPLSSLSLSLSLFYHYFFFKGNSHVYMLKSKMHKWSVSAHFCDP